MKKYRLSDLVDEISIRENNPSKSNYSKFVGLEHYVSGEIEILNFSNTDILASAMKIFQSGDVLVARRNVYLKRAAIVNFDGLTSGDSIVLRAKDSIFAKILPFILNTDNFWDYANKYADGTMSKRLSPKTLLNYEFYLPNLDEQKRLAKILWAGEKVRQQYKKLLQKTDDVVKAKFVEMFGKRFASEKIPLRKLADFTIGLTYNPQNVTENGTIVLRSGNIQNNSLELQDDIVRVSNINIPDNKFVKNKDILMCSRNGSSNLVGKSCLISNPKEKMSFGAFMTVIRSKYPYFLQSFFTSSFFKTQLVNTTTSSVKQITSKMLGDYYVIQPTDKEEKQLAEFVEKVEKSKQQLKLSLDSLNKMIRSIVQESFN